MKNLLELLSHFLLKDLGPTPQPQGAAPVRLIANLVGFCSLIYGYVLGCRVLYHYFETHWGEEGALVVLCLFLTATSILLFTVGWILKPRPSPSKNMFTALEKTVNELPDLEILKKIGRMPQVALTLFTLVVVAYMASHKKKT